MSGELPEIGSTIRWRHRATERGGEGRVVERYDSPLPDDPFVRFTVEDARTGRREVIYLACHAPDTWELVRARRRRARRGHG